jgi:hypothetical protein
MRRAPAAALAAVGAVALVLGAVVLRGGDDPARDADAQVDAAAPEVELASAIAAAQADMPIPVSNSRVGVLLEDLCDGGDGLADQLGALTVADASEADQVVDALRAGTELLCPEGVDPAVDAQARAAALAAAPSTTVAGPSADAQDQGGDVAVGTAGRTSAAPSSSATGGSPASGGSSSTAGAAADGSSGTAEAGGGNATGAGNQSSTGFSQSVGGGGASNQATAG